MNKQPLYQYNPGTGMLTIVNSEPKIKYTHAIFIYEDNEDITDVTDRSPLMFESKKELDKYLASPSGRTDLRVWSDRNQTVVIRPMNIIQN